MDLRKPAQFEKYLRLTQEYHKRRADVATRLLAKYNLEGLTAPGVSGATATRVSRFYPIVKQTIAMLAFKAPKMTMSVEGGDTDATRAAALLERAADEALDIMEVKTELQQILFDALFFYGIGKLDFNQANDAILPYKVNNPDQNDFTAFSRRSPFLCYIDPFAPPHRPQAAHVIVEKMFVPFEFVRKDERYSQRDKIRPIADMQTSSKEGDSMLSPDFMSARHGEDKNTFQELLENEMVCLYEVHDRIHRSLITYADGLKDPIQVGDHHFAAVKDVDDETIAIAQAEGVNPFEVDPTGGFLCTGGTPYFIFQYDMTDQGAYPTPPLAYVEDMQDMVTESQTRRRSLVNNQPRFGLVVEEETNHNPNLNRNLRDAKDREVVPVQSLNNFGTPPYLEVGGDQMTLEADARSYEEETLHMAEAGANQPNRTATQSALISSVATLNREFSQDLVGNFVRDVVVSSFNIFADPRYTPENFQININDDGSGELTIVMERANFLFRYKITVDAGSVQPLAEKMEREETLSLAELLLSVPESNRVEVLKMAIHAHRHPDPDKLLNEQTQADVLQVVHLENLLLDKGEDPGVQAGMDHQGHIDGHGEHLQELQQAMQGVHEQVSINPADQEMSQQLVVLQQLTQLYQQHLQAHSDALSQEAEQIAGGGTGGASTAVNDIESAVRSSAQKLGDAATTQAQAVTEGR